MSIPHTLALSAILSLSRSRPNHLLLLSLHAHPPSLRPSSASISTSHQPIPVSLFLLSALPSLLDDAGVLLSPFS